MWARRLDFPLPFSGWQNGNEPQSLVARLLP
jgi:hypothetical protein